MKARENAVSEPAGQTPLEAICWTHTLDFSTGFFYEGHKYDSRDVKVREASVIKASSEMSPDVKRGLRSGGRKKKSWIFHQENTNSAGKRKQLFIKPTGCKHMTSHPIGERFQMANSFRVINLG